MRGRSSGKTAPPRYPCFTRVSGGAKIWARAGENAVFPITPSNATHFLEAWDCIWLHGALAQARAIQVAASSLWAVHERRLLPGGGHGTMLRHDGAVQRDRQLSDS